MIYLTYGLPVASHRLYRDEMRPEGEPHVDKLLRPVAAQALADIARGCAEVQQCVAEGKFLMR